MFELVRSKLALERNKLVLEHKLVLARSKRVLVLVHSKRVLVHSRHSSSRKDEQTVLGEEHMLAHKRLHKQARKRERTLAGSCDDDGRMPMPV